MAKPDHPNLLDICAVADRLGVSVRHVRRLVAEERIPFLKWGHLLRFDPQEIERFLDAARRPAGAVPSLATSPGGSARANLVRPSRQRF